MLAVSYYFSNHSHTQLKVLVELGGGKVNAADFDGETPLFYAVREQSVDMVKALSGYDVDANHRNDSQENILEFSQSINGSPEITKALESLLRPPTDEMVIASGIANSADVLGYSHDLNSSNVEWMNVSNSHTTR